jgi:short-subunit dehydrogenase
MLLTHAAIPQMRADGVVVNVASLAGKVPVPDEAAYSASKAGLRAFARALDMELELEGKSIRIKTVCPGPVDTAFFGEDLSKVPNLVFSQPMSTVTDIANSVLRLMEGEDQEESVPALSGKLTTMGYLLPNVYKTLRPMLELLGAYNKRVHLSRGGSGTR